MQHDMVPKVSVVMSVFNAADFLEAAMESVLTQTFRDFEFIIIDDGSTDRSADMIRSYGDRRIRLVQQENQGVAAALNRGLALARGEYIARQDADDVSLPERFALQVRFLEAHPEVAVLGTGALLVDSQGLPFTSFYPFTRHDWLVRELRRGVCPLMHGSVMAWRHAILDVGGYAPAFEYLQDVELWLRMSAKYRLANIREVLYYFRKHDRSRTQEAQIDLKIKEFAKTGKLCTRTRAEDWRRFLEDFEKNFPGSWWERAFEAENHLRGARQAAARGHYGVAARSLVRAICLNPSLTLEVPARVWWRLCRRFLPIFT